MYTASVIKSNDHLIMPHDVDSCCRWVHWRYAGPRGVGVLGREGDPMENTVGVDVLGDGSFSGCTLTGSRKYVFVRADSPDLSRGGVHISPFLPPTVRRRVG